MSKLIFSQSGVYRLQQLASQVRHHTGVRHRLADEKAMLAMLRDCAHSNNEVIQSYFAAFTGELDAEQMASLSARGIGASAQQVA